MDVASFVADLPDGAIVLIGEIHGTVESPAFVLDLIRHATATGRPVGVGIEHPTSDQARVDSYVASDGSGEAESILLGGWAWTSFDGRSSRAMLELHRQIRELRHEGRRVEVCLFDAVEAGGDAAPATARDRAMSDVLLAFAHRFADGLVIALCGNVHAMIAETVALVPEVIYRPLGWLCRSQRPNVISLEVVHASGTAWCWTHDGRGVQTMAGVDLGGETFIELDTTRDGFDGFYYLGSLTASPPALDPAG